MKIHFSNVNFSSSTGPNTFGHRLASELSTRGYEIVNSNQKYDVFLCFIEPTSAPDKNAKFIQRLDGIWFKPEEFETHNKGIKYAYDNCDQVIWQSDFDKNMTQHWWGERKGSVIHNGIKINEIKSLDPSLKIIKEKYKKIFVTSSSWHRQKRLKENITLFLSLKEKYKDSCLIVLGKPDYVIDHADIYYPGYLTHQQCLQVYNISDWMLHLAWLDHCPNVVVEAISQNCKVICTDSGGTKEIVKSNGIVIKENIPYNFELTDYDKPYELIIPELDLDDIEIKNEYLKIESIADQYENIFKKE